MTILARNWWAVKRSLSKCPPELPSVLSPLGDTYNRAMAQVLAANSNRTVRVYVRKRPVVPRADMTKPSLSLSLRDTAARMTIEPYYTTLARRRDSGNLRPYDMSLLAPEVEHGSVEDSEGVLHCY